VFANIKSRFDLFLDEKWPVEPPKVNFVLDEGMNRSTSMFSPEAKHSLNPHVHPNGKICLSLLNTWEGTASEKWQPNKSTLLSVFVSIQAMLFGTPEPEEYPRTGSLYNENVQCKNVLYAMLWWLTTERTKKGIWGETSKTYWRCNGAKVLRQVKEWSKTNKLLESYDKSTIDPKDQVRWRRMNLVTTLSNALEFSGSSTRYRY